MFTLKVSAIASILTLSLFHSFMQRVQKISPLL
jgi:hypothetical protein